MLSFTHLLSKFFRDTDAQDLVEYSLVVSLLAFGCLAGMQSLASGISIAFHNVSSGLATSL